MAGQDTADHSEADPGSEKSRTPELTLMELPIEIRHKIYSEVFRTQPYPLLLSGRRQVSSIFGRSEPTLDIGLFRVNRQLYQDSATFFYHSYTFQTRGNFEAFRHFGPLVKASMRDLTIFPSMWGSESQDEQEMWDRLEDFTALEEVKIWVHHERLFPMISHLEDLRANCARRGASPLVALDLRVWEKHLSFDWDQLEYDRSRALISKGIADHSVAPSPRLSPRQQLLRLPIHVRKVTIFSDVSPASARALDEFVAASETPLLVKSVLPVLSHEHNGRSQRLWYQLQLSDL